LQRGSDDAGAGGDHYLHRIRGYADGIGLGGLHMKLSERDISEHTLATVTAGSEGVDRYSSPRLCRINLPRCRYANAITRSKSARACGDSETQPSRARASSDTTGRAAESSSGATMRLRASALLEQGLPSAAVGLLPSDDLLGDVAGGGIVPRASSILDHRYRAVAMGDHHLQEYPVEGDAITGQGSSHVTCSHPAI
jgi:hypothetical protein